MCKRFISFFLLAAFLGCGNRVNIKVTVDADPAALQNSEVFALQVILEQNGDSGTALFENNGEPIDFPVTFSTRVDADRLGDLRIGVAGIDAENHAVLGGTNFVDLNGNDVEAFVLMNNQDPCAAGDGADIGCCTNFLDDDGNGLADCAEQTCADQFPDVCEGAVCGDGIVNPFAGELCDDGNNVDGDGCDSTCLDENSELSAILEYSEVIDFNSGVDVSIMSLFAFLTNPGFTVVQREGDCKKVDLLNLVRQDADFFFVDFGPLSAFREDGSLANSILVDDVGDPIIIGIAEAFADGEPATLELEGGPDLLVPKVLFDDAFPTRLDVLQNEAITAFTRNEDLEVTWTPTGLDENVVVLFFERFGLTQVFCEAPDAQGSIIVPATFTRAFPRGTFADGGGFFLVMGHGLSLEIPVDPDESPNGIGGTLFFNIDHGEQLTGDIF